MRNSLNNPTDAGNVYTITMHSNNYINSWASHRVHTLTHHHHPHTHTVTVTGSRVEITLKKHDSQELWTSIGTFSPGHLNLYLKNNRGELHFSWKEYVPLDT